jgi:hypothetical protein
MPAISSLRKLKQKDHEFDTTVLFSKTYLKKRKRERETEEGRGEEGRGQ